MTNEEAILYLSDINRLLGAPGGFLPLTEAYALAIDALRKQIPMEVIQDDDGEVHCPACEYYLGGGDYHEDCGQALDWSGVK